ncbi:MAG TPA: AAA family ATPase [Ruminococcus sp.]|nr:AAA family ATPase [Ruminococcus sp.]
MEINDIIGKIRSLYKIDQTLVIGIDGAGGAGKSTIAEQLRLRLSELGHNVVLLHIDDFIHPKAVRYNDDYPQWEQYYYLQWRYDYFMQELIAPIKKGAQPKPFELYDKENDKYIVCSCDIPCGSIVIVEGVFLMRKELSGAFDYTIYIDVPQKERLERVLKRDGYIGDRDAIIKKYSERYFPAEDHYYKAYKPKEKADIVI